MHGWENFSLWIYNSGWAKAIRDLGVSSISDHRDRSYLRDHLAGRLNLNPGFCLMGLTFRDEPVSKLAKRFLPRPLFGFLTQVTTGILMWSSEAIKMNHNWAFSKSKCPHRGGRDQCPGLPHACLPERGYLGQRAGGPDVSPGSNALDLAVFGICGARTLDRLRCLKGNSMPIKYSN